MTCLRQDGRSGHVNFRASAKQKTERRPPPRKKQSGKAKEQMEGQNGIVKAPLAQRSAERRCSSGRTHAGAHAERGRRNGGRVRLDARAGRHRDRPQRAAWHVKTDGRKAEGRTTRRPPDLGPVDQGRVQHVSVCARPAPASSGGPALRSL